MNNFVEKAKAVVVGHAVGDALGVPVEFRPREYLDKYPITNMIGYGSHNMPAGSWSDDTSMALCTLDSFANNSEDVLQTTMQNFVNWLFCGGFTPTGKPSTWEELAKKQYSAVAPPTMNIPTVTALCENSSGGINVVQRRTATFLRTL